MVSALELFSLGIGPSSSHTVGPMRAANRFLAGLSTSRLIDDVRRVHVELFGSLGATGKGHGSDTAVILGLLGCEPETVDPDDAVGRAEAAVDARRLQLADGPTIDFHRAADITMHLRRRLPQHPNGMTFTAFDAAGTQLASETYFSIGGGFVVDEEHFRIAQLSPVDEVALPHPFATGAELLRRCASSGLRISELVRSNESELRNVNDAQLDAELLRIWEAMRSCVSAGCARPDDELPGGLRVRRRAPRLYRELLNGDAADHALVMEWVNLFALAVNEENASGKRVVTAPTNGAAGIIPAVLHYYVQFVPGADERGVIRFLLAASAFGLLLKANASISGAEVGCQGEVGSACAMAAAGLAEALGGSPAQVENAAEIGLEHNLGLTCDPVGGLVQIPCIERNAIAAIKAINAARMALRGDGTHRVSFDEAVATMRQTGADMHAKYKETSRGGLAVNVVAC